MKNSDLKTLVAIIGILILISPVFGQDTTSSMSPPMKSPESLKPYEDSKFIERADFAIKNLVNPLPTGNDLLELKSIYYEIVMMNISPDFYQKSYEIAKYLYYTMKAAEGVQHYDEHTGKNRIYMDFHEKIYDQAKIDSSLARQTWRNISTMYPGSSPALA